MQNYEYNFCVMDKFQFWFIFFFYIKDLKLRDFKYTGRLTFMPPMQFWLHGISVAP